MQDNTILLKKSSLDIGDVLNERYIIENVIDRGGMGIVLGARHIRLNERVAIKILLPESSTNPNMIARFIREGQTIAQIKSDYVVRVLDVDATPAGMPFLVLEWLDGQDLKSFCRSRKADAVEIGFAVRCILEACQALEVAHALGIVHRDIKPSNMFLCRGPRGSVRVKLIDFGISKKNDASPIARDERTKTGIILGTTEYMSPEQIQSCSQVDGRADIWSLGVTLYKLVTGHTPFRASEPAATCALILGAAPLPPSALCPDLPADLETIILKCLDKNPANRYADVRELARALRPFAENEATTMLFDAPQSPSSMSVSAPALVSPSMIPAKATRHRALGLLGAVAVIVVIIIALAGTLRPPNVSVLQAEHFGTISRSVPPPVLRSAMPESSSNKSTLPEPTPVAIPDIQPRPTAPIRAEQTPTAPPKRPETISTKIEPPIASKNTQEMADDPQPLQTKQNDVYHF